MKPATLTLLLFLTTMLNAQTPLPGNPAEHGVPGTNTGPAAAGNGASPEKLTSQVYDWDKLTVTPTPKGVRRDVFDGPTTSLDQAHCHITTLNPGENSGEPRLHLQEEIIIVKEGLVEMHIDGRTQTAGPGSVFFLAARATTRLRNAGSTSATYIVIYYYTPLTPKP
jgi:mannose-6-phosphate isomerase-like protein (cupin superfamily)